jgi:hypothetical protein
LDRVEQQSNADESPSFADLAPLTLPALVRLKITSLYPGVICNEFLRRLLLRAICPRILSLRIEFAGNIRDFERTLPRHSDIESSSTALNPFRRAFQLGLVKILKEIAPRKNVPIIAPDMAHRLDELLIIPKADSNVVVVDTTAFLCLFGRHREDATSTIVTKDGRHNIEFHD